MTEGSVIILLVVAFGACVGSFLNVCIYRLPRRESLLWPGSRCTSCGRALSWYEKQPGVGWVALGGMPLTTTVEGLERYPAECHHASWHRRGVRVQRVSATRLA